MVLSVGKVELWSWDVASICLVLTAGLLLFVIYEVSSLVNMSQVEGTHSRSTTHLDRCNGDYRMNACL